jgi:L-iditol 2-dehydrogenase
VKLPDTVDHASCALLGVAGVAMRAIRRLRVAAGQKVWVVGVGPIGIFGAQCARAVGAHVTVSELVPDRLRAARETGAHCTIDMDADDAWNQVAANAPYDVIYDGSGYERLFFDIFERRLLARGGAIGAIAVRAETTFPWAMLHTTEASIEVSCHFSVSELECLLHLIGAGAVQIDPIVSHRVSIDEAPEVYATMRDDPRALYGVIFDWT